MDAFALRKSVKNSNTVVAHCSQAKAELPELLSIPIQLNELAFAVGSPVCGAEKQDQRAFRTKQALEGARFTVLVLKIEVRQRGAHGRSVFASR